MILTLIFVRIATRAVRTFYHPQPLPLPLPPSLQRHVLPYIAAPAARARATPTATTADAHAPSRREGTYRAPFYRVCVVGYNG
jgi:hypothetical protein